METPNTPMNDLIGKISEYWGYIVGGITASGAAYGFYRKYLKGKYKAFKTWCEAVVKAPVALAAIKAELEYESGITIRQKLELIGDDIAKLGHIVSNEIANRRAALQAVETPLFEFDINGKFVWANDSLLEVTESETSDVLGNNWRNFIAGPDRSAVLEGWQMAVKDGSDFKAKFRLGTDGMEQWVLFSVVCNKDVKGNVLGWIGKLRKIDDPRIHSTQG